MGKTKRFKDEVNAPVEIEDVVDRLEDVADRLDASAEKFANQCIPQRQRAKDDEPVFAMLDLQTKEALISACGQAAQTEIKTLLEARQKRFAEEAAAKEKYNEEHGFRTFEEVYEAQESHYKRLVDCIEDDSKVRSELNKSNRQVRNWQINEFRALKRYGDAKFARLEEMYNQALNKSGIKKPALPTNGGFFDMQMYYFVQLPAYWFKCFFFDPHTKNYFRILIASCWIITLSLMGFMADHEAKLEREAEKYKIIRLWTYADDGSDVKARIRHLDALFEDEKNNRQEINDLIIRLNGAYGKQITKSRK